MDISTSSSWHSNILLTKVCLDGIYMLMITSHLLTLLREAKLSPEQLGSRIGVSGMTLRRCRMRSPARPLPGIVEKKFVDAVYQLASEGRLSVDSASVKNMLANKHYIPFRMAITHLGCSEAMLEQAKNDPRRLIECVAQIGDSVSRRVDVDEKQKKISSFMKISNEWTSRISLLQQVIRSRSVLSFEKLVAYGALFYLITPLDLIPDHIPVFGLMDDFSILGFAVAYYTKLLSKLPKQRRENMDFRLL